VAELASGALEVPGIQSGHWPGFGFVFIAFTEFRRAVAAEQRYEDLKGRSTAALAREGIARADVPRRIFEEFYSLESQRRRANEAEFQTRLKADTSLRPRGESRRQAPAGAQAVGHADTVYADTLYIG
jgi:hypothetical protein